MREAVAILQPKGGRDTKSLELHVLEDLHLGLSFFLSFFLYFFLSFFLVTKER